MDDSDIGMILKSSETAVNFNKFVKIKKLLHIGVLRKNAEIREVVGTEIEARQLFNQRF